MRCVSCHRAAFSRVVHTCFLSRFRLLLCAPCFRKSLREDGLGGHAVEHPRKPDKQEFRSSGPVWKATCGTHLPISHARAGAAGPCWLLGSVSVREPVLTGKVCGVSLRPPSTGEDVHSSHTLTHVNVHTHASCTHSKERQS